MRPKINGVIGTPCSNGYQLCGVKRSSILRAARGDLARLAARATNVVGVDHHAEFISAARQRCPKNCAFLQADLRTLAARVIPRADGLGRASPRPISRISRRIEALDIVSITPGMGRSRRDR